MLPNLFSADAQLCILNSPYPRPGHIRRRISSDTLQLHKHSLLMLVFHHNTFAFANAGDIVNYEISLT